MRRFELIQFVLFVTILKMSQAQILNPILECDFEKELVCGKTQDQDDDFDWIYGQGPTEAMFTGPEFDNTFKNASGTYLYIKSDGDRTGTVASIRISPLGAITQGWARIIFAYHMLDARSPDRMGTLSVTACGYELWSRTGNQSKNWLKAAMTFQCDQTRPEIVFQGIRGGEDSDIAIDDVLLFDVEGPVFTTAATTLPPVPTNATLIGNPSGLNSSMLAVVITFSVIGFLLLLCVVSTFLRKQFRTLDVSFFLECQEKELVPDANVIQDNQYMTLNGQSLGVYMGVNIDTTLPVGVLTHHSTAALAMTGNNSASLATAMVGVRPLATDEETEENEYAQPARQTGDYLRPISSEQLELEPEQYLQPISTTSTKQPVLEHGEYLQPISTLSTKQPVPEHGEYLQPISTLSTKQPVLEHGEYLQPISTLSTKEPVLEHGEYLQPISKKQPVLETGTYQEPILTNKSTPESEDYVESVAQPLSVDTYAEVRATTTIKTEPKVEQLDASGTSDNIVDME